MFCLKLYGRTEKELIEYETHIHAHMTRINLSKSTITTTAYTASDANSSHEYLYLNENHAECETVSKSSFKQDLSHVEKELVEQVSHVTSSKTSNEQNLTRETDLTKKTHEISGKNNLTVLKRFEPKTRNRL